MKSEAQPEVSLWQSAVAGGLHCVTEISEQKPVPSAGAYAKRLRRECFNRECWCEVLFLVCAGCLRIHGCAIAQTMLLMLCDRLV